MCKCLAISLLILIGRTAVAQISYPEMFENFITGWVSYDKGEYAASYRAFRRAKALDPDFLPAQDASISSLRQMGLPELADFSLRQIPQWQRSQTSSLEPKLAFWGVFSEQTFEVTGVESIAAPLLAILREEIALPVIEVSPTSRAWADRRNMAGCQYNMLVMLSPTSVERDGLTARIHLMEAFDVESGNELDLDMPLPEHLNYRHRTCEFDIGDTALPAFLNSPQGRAEIRGLIFGDWLNPVAPFVVDAESATLPPVEQLTDAGDIISKLATSEQAPWQHYLSISFKARNFNGVDRDLLQDGYLAWMLSTTPRDDPHRPWLLGAAAILGGFTHFAKWYPEHFVDNYGDNDFASELLEVYPEHVLAKVLRMNEGLQQLDLQNYQKLIPGLLEQLEVIMATAESELYSSDGNRSLENLDRLLRFYIGEIEELNKHPNFPQTIYLTHTEGRYSLGVRSDAMLWTLQQKTAKDAAEREIYAQEAWRMLELNALSFANDPVALYHKHAAMLKRAPDSPFLQGAVRKIGYALQAGGYDELLASGSADNLNRALRMIRSNEPMISVRETLPWSDVDQEARKQVGEALEDRFRNYGLRAVGHKKLGNFLYTISSYKIDLYTLDTIVHDTIVSLIFTQLEEPSWGAFDDFADYVDFLYINKHYDAHSELLLTAVPYVWKAAYSLNILDSRMRLADRMARMLLLINQADLALGFTRIGIEQYSIEPERPDELTDWRIESREEVRFQLYARQSHALLELGRHEELRILVAEALDDLDGRNVPYKAWADLARGKNTVGEFLLKVRDESDLRSGFGGENKN